LHADKSDYLLVIKILFNYDVLNIPHLFNFSLIMNTCTLFWSVWAG